MAAHQSSVTIAAVGWGGARGAFRLADGVLLLWGVGMVLALVMYAFLREPARTWKSRRPRLLRGGADGRSCRRASLILVHPLVFSYPIRLRAC